MALLNTSGSKPEQGPEGHNNEILRISDAFENIEVPAILGRDSLTEGPLAEIHRKMKEATEDALRESLGLP